MSFGLLFSPSGSAGACRGSCPPMGRSRRRTGPATDRGLDFHAGNPLSSLFAHGQEQDLPGSLAIHPVTLRRSTTPDDPLRLAISGASGAAPTRLTMKASSFTDFEAARRFVTCCLRFTTGVTARHARLASGWRAAPLPGGSRTRWIATRGFSSCHPPLQGFPWRNNRSARPWLPGCAEAADDHCGRKPFGSTLGSHPPVGRLHGLAERLPAFFEIGRRDERQGAAAGTGFAILVLTESLRKRNQAREDRPWVDNINKG